ncbi:sensor histidine kinase [Nonomuraea sp. NPDC055795]
MQRALAVAAWSLACVMFAVNAGMLATVYVAPLLWTVVLAAACAAPVVLCRTRPMVAWALLGGAMLVTPFVASPPPSGNPWPWLPMPIVAYLIVLGVLATRLPRPALAGVLALTLAGAAATLGLVTRPPGIAPALVLAMAGVLAAVPLLLGDAVRVRRLAQARAAEQEQIGAVERARRELLEERTRIAREMHDVVAHHMSVIAIQASSASRRLGGLSREAEREFADIGAAARQSMAEMRRLLGVLRSPETPSERAPLPGLAQVETLVATARRAGTPVELSMTGLPADLPASVDVTLYRVVQEAVSNVLRHAPGTAARVALSGNGTTVRVLIENDVTGAPTPTGQTSRTGNGHEDAALSAGGHGLMGMRERAAMLGGQLVAGPAPGGGFRVELTFPLAHVMVEDR